MEVTLSCSFATSNGTPEHIRIAEGLGFRRAFCYDSPPIYPDAWMQLARAADRTTSIGLGPGVLVPSLRHPMTNAAAIGTLVSLVGPERVCVAIGAGFTGRLMMGQRPLKWSEVHRYVAAIRGLLRGEEVEWDGKIIKLMHDDGFGVRPPIDVPILVGAGGPKGAAVARELGDGVMCSPEPVAGFEWTALNMSGTVLDEGEDIESERVIQAAGPMSALLFHYLYEVKKVHLLPDSEKWASVYDAIDPATRHLALHERHLTGVTDRDRPFLSGRTMAAQGLAFSPAQLRDKISALQAAGVTEVVFQPAGPDIARELEAFADAARG
jgi:5,10-methylenetetrahydromethanopterin reductase